MIESEFETTEIERSKCVIAIGYGQTFVRKGAGSLVYHKTYGFGRTFTCEPAREVMGEIKYPVFFANNLKVLMSEKSVLEQLIEIGNIF